MIAVPILKHEWNRRQFSQSHFKCIPQLDATLRRADRLTQGFNLSMLPIENSYRPGVEPGEGRRTFHHPLPNDPHSMAVSVGIGGRHWGGGSAGNNRSAGNNIYGNPIPIAFPQIVRRRGGAVIAGASRDADGDVGGSSDVEDDGFLMSGGVGDISGGSSSRRTRLIQEESTLGAGPREEGTPSRTRPRQEERPLRTRPRQEETPSGTRLRQEGTLSGTRPRQEEKSSGTRPRQDEESSTPNPQLQTPGNAGV